MQDIDTAADAVPAYETTVSGDAENGWVVDLHDGERATSHTCYAETEQEAVAKAIADRQSMSLKPAIDVGDDRLHQAIEELGARVAKLEAGGELLAQLRIDVDALAQMPDHKDAIAAVHKRLDDIESLVTSPSDKDAAEKPAKA